MNFSLKLLLAITGLGVILFQVDFPSPGQKKIIPLHFVKGIDGRAILSNVNRLLESHRQSLGAHDLFSQTDAEISSNAEDATVVPPSEGHSPADLVAIHPQLGNLWNNTTMIFGASADGIGIGTSFVINQPDPGTALLVSNFHVVQEFCQIPHDQVTDHVQADDLKYSCQSLFVLHDVAINTQTNQTTLDGDQPWKSEIHSLLFFDKKLDLAVFRIALPPEFTLTVPAIEMKLDLKDPVDLYLVSYSSDGPSEGIIRKSWHRGSSDGFRAFENDERLGLINAIKHNIEIKPGSSGAPLALADGRVIGVNASLEMNQFYGNSGCSRKLETYLSYYAIPAFFLKPVLPPETVGVSYE